MTKLTEQQKQIARETFDKERAMCGWSHPRELYAAVAAVLEQQGWPTDAECRADAPGGPLAQRTPEPAPQHFPIDRTDEYESRIDASRQPAPAPQSTADVVEGHTCPGSCITRPAHSEVCLQERLATAQRGISSPHERIAKTEAERDMLRHDLYERGELVTAQNFAEMQQRAELAEEQLRRIYDWCDAYPLGFGSGIFDEPDMKQVQALLGDELLTQLSAHNFRHVLNGVKAIAARNEEPII